MDSKNVEVIHCGKISVSCQNDVQCFAKFANQIINFSKKKVCEMHNMF